MLEVEEYGDGPPLVLIHGSPANGKTWKAVGERLADRFRVIAPTLPDHGADGFDAPGEISTEDMAEAIERTIGNLDQPIRLAAHSFGSNVALNIALRGRIEIDRLVLFEPVTMMILPIVGETAAYTAARSTFDSYIRRFRDGDGRAVETMIEFWFGPGAFQRMPAPVQAYLVERTEVNVRDVESNFAEAYTPEMLAELGLEVTIVLGGASPVITGTIATAMAGALGNATVEIIDGADHAMLVTHPDQVAQLIGR